MAILRPSLREFALFDADCRLAVQNFLLFNFSHFLRFPSIRFALSVMTITIELTWLFSSKLLIQLKTNLPRKPERKCVTLLSTGSNCSTYKLSIKFCHQKKIRFNCNPSSPLLYYTYFWNLLPLIYP